MDIPRSVYEKQVSATVSLGEALASATRALAASGVEEPLRESRLLASHVLAEPVTPLSDTSRRIDIAAFAALVGRRAAREPLAFITGRHGFWTQDLAVGPDTLIPRADSETLIEAALKAQPVRRTVRRILDLGTGTGCLLLAALSEFTDAFGIGVDMSPAAAGLAALNARACGLASRAGIIAGDWGAALGGSFDLILCNPPYIVSADLAGLMPEVGRYEPRRALDGGPSGLDSYARILPSLRRLLAPNGVAVFELGIDQEAGVAGLAERTGLAHLLTLADLSGIPRAMVLGFPPRKKAFGSRPAGR